MNLHPSHEHTPSTRTLRVHGVSIHGDAVGRLAERRFFVACAASFQQPTEQMVRTRPADGRAVGSGSNGGFVIHADAASVVTVVDVVTIRRLHFRLLRPTLETRRMLMDLVGLWRRRGGGKDKEPLVVTGSDHDSRGNTTAFTSKCICGGSVMDLQFYDCVLDERWQRDLLQSVVIGAPLPVTLCRQSQPLLRTFFYQYSGVTSSDAAAAATVGRITNNNTPQNNNNNNNTTAMTMNDERFEQLFHLPMPLSGPSQTSSSPPPSSLIPLSERLLPEAAGLSLFAFVTALDLSYQLELQSLSFLLFNDQRRPTMPHLERLRMRSCIRLRDLTGIECVAATLVELCISDSNVDTLAPLRPCSALEELWVDGCTSITSVDDYFPPLEEEDTSVHQSHSRTLVPPPRLKIFYICGSGLPDHVAVHL